ncbi:MAG: GxxExxY protein [Gammaproteobacteria bacterium]|nr:MAG: GxxExxY protein [Gammaproteobacteria bacterium]
MPRQHSPLSQMLYEIRGVAMKVQNQMGTAHQEAVYHRLFVAALQKAGFRVESQPRLDIQDAHHNVVKHYYPDLRVTHRNLQVLVEIKASPGGLQPSHMRQARAYLSVDRKSRSALLINFARKPLEHKTLFRKDI